MADLYVTVAQCLKHIRRYGTVDIDNKTLERIFLYAMRGINCKEDHLDIAQRSSLSTPSWIPGSQKLFP